MEPLETNRYLLTWLCVYPNSRDTSSSMVFVKSVFAVQCFVVTFLLLLSSIIFACNNFQNNLDRALHGVLQSAALLYTAYIQISGRLQRRKISNTIGQISKFYSFRKFIYKKAESYPQYLFKLNRFYLYFVIWWWKRPKEPVNVQIPDWCKWREWTLH